MSDSTALRIYISVVIFILNNVSGSAKWFTSA